MKSEIVFKYFPDLTELQKSRIIYLEELYAFWNSQINVISRKDFDNFYLHHVLHSLAIAKIVQFKNFTEILDAGTGGGFPGIPLAILYPGANFYLVDSVGKKIKVVNEVVKSLQLENVKTEQTRMEQVDHTFDFVISRAVTSLPDFVRWTAYKVHKKSFNKIPNGILYLKGGDVNEELIGIRQFRKKVYNLPEFFCEDYFETKKLIHLYK